jgi:flagellar hook assembly protein FlgD
VKITNVPDQCVVTIYSVNGTKIRQFKKDSPVTSIDWDLTNHAGTPIASGIYIIHVKDNVNGGEQTVKFYCAMRQIDLNTF